MYKKILLISTIIFTVSYPSNASMTSKEFLDVERIAKQECNKIHKHCYIGIDDNEIISAYTLKDNCILLSTGAIYKLNKNELLAIVLHEIGHIKSNDNFKLQVYKKVMPKLLTNKSIRYNMEYKADEYAVNYFSDKCMHNYLIDTFNKLERADKNKDTVTHPSLNKRIKNAEKIHVNKCNK